MRSAIRWARLAAGLGCAAAGLGMLLSLLFTSGRPVVVALQAFSALALPLLAIAALLLVVPLTAVARRALALPLALALVVGIAIGLTRAVPAWTASPAKDHGRHLRVMSANLRLGLADPAAVMDAVRGEHPDLLVLQEITPGLLRRLDAAGLRAFLPYAAGEARPGATGTMAFAKAPLTSVERIEAEHVSVAFRFEDLEVWGVHPAYPYSANWLRDQAHLAERAAHDRPDLALGDFNASIDNPPFRDVVRRGGFRDAAEQAGSGWQPTWPTDGFRGIPLPLAAIDHVLVGERLAATATRTHVIAGTDHKALVADLRVRRAAP